MLRFIRCVLNGTHFPLTVLRMCNWGTISAPSYFAQVTPTDTCFGNLFSVTFFQNPNTTCLQGERRWQVRQQREAGKEQIRGECLKRHRSNQISFVLHTSCRISFTSSSFLLFIPSAGICHLCLSITPAQFTGFFTLGLSWEHHYLSWVWLFSNFSDHEVVRECTMILYIVIIKKKKSHSYSEYFLK